MNDSLDGRAGHADPGVPGHGRIGFSGGLRQVGTAPFGSLDDAGDLDNGHRFDRCSFVAHGATFVNLLSRNEGDRNHDLL